MIEDSMVGLSIEGSSDSCSSELSLSHRSISWHSMDLGENDDILELQARPLSAEINADEELGNYQYRNCSADSFPAGSRQDCEGMEVACSSPSFRSRAHRKPSSPLDKGINVAGNKKTQQGRPRLPSLRFSMTLFTLTLILLSLAAQKDADRNLGSSAFEEELRREEIPLSLDRSLGDMEELSSRKIVESVQKFEAVSRKRNRANFAMARAPELRPVFGAVDERVERFVLDNTPPKPVAPPPGSEQGSWTRNFPSWLAVGGLLAMLAETGVREYRQCQKDDFLEEQRRL